MLNFSENTVARAREFDRGAAPEKIRVHAFAKALDMSSRELIDMLAGMDVAVKSASSTVPSEVRNRVLDTVVGTAGSLADDSAPASAPERAADTSDESAAEKDSGKAPAMAADSAEEKPAKKAAKKAAKKSAKKAAKKSTKKSAGKSSRKAAEEQAPKAAKTADEPVADADEAKGAPAQTEIAVDAAVDAPETDAVAAADAAVDAATDANAADTDATADSDSAEAPRTATRRRSSRRVARKAQTPKKAGPGADQAPTEAAGKAAMEKIDAEAAEAAEAARAADAADDSADADELPGAKTATRKRSSRKVTRKSHAPEPTASESAESTDAVDAADTAPAATADVAADASVSTDSDDEVMPPVTPPPAEPAYAMPLFMAPDPAAAVAAPVADDASADEDLDDTAADRDDDDDSDDGQDVGKRNDRVRRRRRGRGRGRGRGAQGDDAQGADEARDERDESGDSRGEDSRDADGTKADADEDKPEVPVVDEPVAIRGSTRLEAARRRRVDRREQSRKRHVISEAEFLARRESVERTMVVRERERTDHHGWVTQVGVLEDDLLVEHFVTSDTQTSIIGDVYLGRVQNVLPSMEAAFIDIGTDRNGVLYSADINWRAMKMNGRSRRIEHALKAGDQVLVQATKDPIGHKGARLSMQISLAGRFLVYVPGGNSAGISRKLPEPERKRLKEILKEVTPQGSGTIIRTAAEGVPKEAIAADVDRLEKTWQEIDKRAKEAKARKGAKPLTMYEEPNMLVKVVRDLFNEDFTRLVVEGRKAWDIVRGYVDEVAPDLADRLQRYNPEQHGNADVFEHFRIDEQLAKALDRKVWLPSGGTLIIERTEAMTVVDVNTGKFTGAGGNLEETVTRNNLEAAEEIVRQMRLRDLGGMIVVDFIDMVLPENQDLVLRRLKEALGRDRTRHEVSEVTSLGLVQMTRKRLGTGLLETFSTTCEACDGRGLILHTDPVDHEAEQQRRKRGDQRRRQQPPKPHPAAKGLHKDEVADESADAGAKDTGRDDSRDGRDAKDSDDSRQDSRGGSRRRRRGRGRDERSDDRRDDRDQRPGDRRDVHR
ncbi:MAG TPA: Rne/Rng family ribonuclease, partial [Actinomycetales bacterium]|nr:Rne/Rng family ribonuclease [Actinomycetales bacterium]